MIASVLLMTAVVAATAGETLASLAPRVREIAVLRRTAAPSEAAARSKRPDDATARQLSAVAGIELTPRRVRLGGSEVYRLTRAVAPDDAELASVLARLREQPDVIYADPIVRVRRSAPRGARRASNESSAAVGSVAPGEDEADVAAELPQQPSIEHLMVVLEPGTELDDAELARLGALAGSELRRERSISGGGVLLALDPPVAASDAEWISRRLRADARVADAAPDMPMGGTAEDPNDPEFTREQARYLGPVSGTRPGAANVTGAWELTKGSSAVTVAVLDSGIYRGHADFDPERVIPTGYDFVSRSTPVGKDDEGGSADGSPRDPDASDPILDASKCGGKSSRILHGSHVAGVIGAWTDNRFGVAGVDWNGRILPVRVLGACKQGVESDVIDGIRWAAGVPPSGPDDPLSNVRLNTTPAHVINLSLATNDEKSAPCSAPLQAAIDSALAHGAIVVTAVGQSNGIPLTSPANCNGVIAVGGHGLYDGRYGSKVNYGTGIDVSAPYDGYVSAWLRQRVLEGQACPASEFRPQEGTSQGAALVSGVVALMKAVAPTLTAGQAESALRSTAVPFTGGECGHDPNECGPGRLDAAAAVAAVRAPTATASSASARAQRPAAALAVTPQPAPRLAAGGAHTCAIVGDDELTCWGSNDYGQVGDGTTIERRTPVPIGLPGPVEAIATSFYDRTLSNDIDETCALFDGGQLSCWGGLGNPLPTTIPLPEKAVSIAVSSLGHTCALLASGKIRCWGSNEYGQLGNGTSGLFSNGGPSDVVGITDAVAVSVGARFSCAVLTNGSVRCWGFNGFGELGDGSRTDSDVPVTVVGPSGAVGVSSGAAHTCAVLGNGRIRCWGANEWGQLGDGTFDNQIAASAAEVVDVTTATTISAGRDHTCALLAGGERRCWGSNSHGQLGVDGVLRSNRPVIPADGCESAVEIAAGGEHTCQRDVAGRVRCWGSAERGQLGNDETFLLDSALPVPIDHASSFVSVASGRDFSCALDTERKVWCWGDNTYGQVGAGDRALSPRPRRVEGLEGATKVVAGLFHACAMRDDGSIRCWGAGFSGQLGHGQLEDRLVPTAVAQLSNAIALDAGSYHTCAVLRGGLIKCWGSNLFGQLGIGGLPQQPPEPLPVVVGSIDSAVDVSCGDGHSCARLSDGSVLCWGFNNRGQVGDGGDLTDFTRSVFETTPTPVVDLDGAATDISAGREHTCAVLEGNRVACWGNLFAGPSSLPVRMSGLAAPVTSISVGGDFSEEFPIFLSHACAIVSGGGALRCWGANYAGQLGDDTRVAREAPVSVLGLGERIRSVSAGGRHTCAVLESGKLRCWGYNIRGQLGAGTTGLTPLAVAVEGYGLSFCEGVAATITGTEADDTLVGTPGNDVIVGLGGDDLIDGRAGEDLICAGPGRDVAFGGIGNDRILGEDGADRLTGNDGDDVLIGGAGRDTLKGSGGRDQLDGGEADDVCNGGGGAQDVAVTCEKLKRIP